MSSFDEKVSEILGEAAVPAKIRYSGAKPAPWKDDNHDWIVSFKIDSVTYEYVLHGETFKIFDWMDVKKKLSDNVLFNYAKKNSSTVYKIVDGIKTKLES